MEEEEGKKGLEKEEEESAPPPLAKSWLRRCVHAWGVMTIYVGDVHSEISCSFMVNIRV